MPKPLVAVSSCLLGERVRHDGRDKLDAGLLAALGPHVEWVPVCPEVEVGMGVPREAVDVIETGGARRLVSKSGRDWTDAMVRHARLRAEELKKAGVSGYVFKKDSPSCGVGARGLFAETLRALWPELPVAEEDELRDAASREAFLRRVLDFSRDTMER